MAGKKHKLSGAAAGNVLDSGLFARILQLTSDAILSVDENQRKQLVQLNRIELLGTVTSALMHELNQPLTAILSNAQVLARICQPGTTCDEEMTEIIADLISESARAGTIIAHLQSLLKAADVNKEPVDINQMIEGVLQLIKSEIVIKRIDLTTEFEESMPIVSGSFVHLQQLLLNLLQNAIEAMNGMESGDRNICIGTRLSGSNTVEIFVRDSGTGFPEGANRDFFKPFFTTKGKSLGMGLAASEAIAKAHEGFLGATRNQGSGATFCLTLPVLSGSKIEKAPTVIEQEQKKAQEQKKIFEWDSASEPEKAPPPTVFVVDDDPSVLKAMHRLISSAGYQVEIFSSAQAFLEREEFTGYGCLLADLHMPLKSGLDLQAELNERVYTLPIIFVTGAGETSSGVLAMKQGALDFLPKPVDETKLFSLLERAIDIDHYRHDQHQELVFARERIERLTPREKEVMKQVVLGQLNKQIAYTLGISEKTVKAHRGKVMHKLEVRSVADLVRLSEISSEQPGNGFVT